MVDSPEGLQVETRKHKLNVMPAWSIWAGAGFVLGVAAVVALLLFLMFGAGTPVDKARLEIIRLVGTIVIGTGGAAALLLAARRQRSTEISLVQTDRDLAYKEESATHARHDANERRATELYTAAAEQLGSDKAPVRMAGLYALERFGNANPDFQQTVVNLLCAYLRMPFVHPDHSEGSADEIEEPAAVATTDKQTLYLDLSPSMVRATGLSLDAEDPRRQELQVRLTAQRILAEHLRQELDESDETPTNEELWEGMSIDLTGAVLDGFNLSEGVVYDARFDNAKFYGVAALDAVHFQGVASFKNTVFHDQAWFDYVKCAPRGGIIIRGVRFDEFAGFEGIRCQRDMSIEDTLFRGEARFDLVNFGSLRLTDVNFFDIATFRNATFDVRFEVENTQFHGEVVIDGARYNTDRVRNIDKWPSSWKCVPPQGPGEGKIEGLEGNWGFIRMDESSNEA